LFSSKSFPLTSAGPLKPQKLTASKIKNEKVGRKENKKNGYFGTQIFEEIEFFEHLKYNLTTS
jgi:hypothetical protein